MINNSLFFFLIIFFSITTFSIDIIVVYDLHVIVVKVFPLTAFNSHLNSASGYVNGKSKFIFSLKSFENEPVIVNFPVVSHLSKSIFSNVNVLTSTSVSK